MRILSAWIASTLVAGNVLGQGAPFPNKPVRVVSASIGSPQDVIGRIAAQTLSELWGQPVVIENRPGAGALISIQAVVKAPADGYTLLVSSTTFAVMPAFYPRGGYDSERDLVPLAMFAASPIVFVAHPGFGVKDMKEALVRAREGKLHFGSPGAGTTPHLSAQFVFGSLANVSISHVAYKGMGPFITALSAGEIPLGAASLPAVLAQLRAGKMQGLAVTSARRAVAAPTIPTIAETGLTGFEDENWVAFWAPAGTPPDLLAKLGADLERAATMPDTLERLAAIGFEPARVSRAELPAYVSRELAKWTRVVKETGAKAD